MMGREKLCGRTIVMAGAIAVLWLALPASVLAGEATDRVRDELNRITAIVRDPTLQGAAKEDERKARIKELILRWFDVKEMARRSLAGHWATRSEEERQDFAELFGDLFVESYTRLVVDHLGDQRVIYLPESVDGGVATVQTKFLSKRDEPSFVDFAMFRQDGIWAAYDVVIDEVSIVKTYRTQFNKIIQTQSYEALVKKMRLKQESEGLGRAAKGSR
ncbi:MAG: ABC transporter substrate-binding protein [candidate division NC10 bacterium]